MKPPSFLTSAFLSEAPSRHLLERRLSRFGRSVALIAALALPVGQVVRAATDNWTGATDGNWASANWSGGGTTPASGDSLVFGSATGVGGTTLTDNLMTPSSYTIGSITFNSSAAAFTINPSASTSGFTLTGGISDQATNAEVFNDNITLGANQSFTATLAAGVLTIGGTDTGAGVTLTTNGSGANIGSNTFFTGSLSIGSLNAQGATGNAPSGVNSNAAGNYSVEPATTFNGGSNLTVTNNVSIGRSNLVFTGNSVANISGTLGNVGASSIDWASLTIAGSANVTAGQVNMNANSVTGQLNLNGGTLTTGGIAGIGALSAAFGGPGLYTEFNGTQVVASGNNATFVTVTPSTITSGDGSPDALIGNGGALFNSNGFAIATTTPFTNAPSATGFLVKSGSGSLTLGGTSGYTGATTVENGVLIAGTNAAVSSNGAFGNASSAIILGDANSITNNYSPSLLTGGAFTVGRAVTVGVSNASTTGTYTLGGNAAAVSTFSGTLTLNQGLTVSQIAGGTTNLTGNIISGASGTETLIFNNAGLVSQSTGVIGGGTGTIAVSQAGAGTTTLSGVNTYTGGTTLSAGILNVNSDAALGTAPGSAATNITFAGNSTLQLGGAFTLNSNRSVAINSGDTATIDTHNFAVTVPGTISGSGSLTIIDSSVLHTGVVTLSGNESYTGATTIGTVGAAAGTLNLTGSLGNTVLTVNSGGVLEGQGNNSTTGVLAGSVTVKGGGAITLTGASNSTALTLNNGLTLGASGPAYGAGNYADLNYTLASGGNAEAIDLGPAGNATGLLTLNSGGAYVTYTNANPIVGTYTLLDFGSVTGSGFFSLSPTSDVTTETVGRNTLSLIESGTTLTLTVAGPGTPGVAYYDAAVSSNWSDLSNATKVNWSTDSLGHTDAGNVPGQTTDVILTATNVTGVVATSLGGNTTINSLNFDAVATSNTISADGSTLTIEGLGDSNHSSDSSNPNSYTGNAAGTGILIASGAGAVTVNVPIVIANSQSWTNGSTNTFTVGGAVNGMALAGSSNVLTIANTNGGTTNVTGSIGDGSIGGTLALAFHGNGLTILSGSNIFSGGVSIASGTLEVNNASALNATNPTAVAFGASSTGVLLLNGFNATLSSLTTNAAAGTPLVANGGALASTLTVNIASGVNTYAGAIQNGTGGGTLAVTKAGAGTLALTGNNTYSGGTAITAGTLILSGNNSGGGGVTLTAGTLDVNSSNALGTGTLALNGGTIDNTSGGAITNAVANPITLGGNVAFSTSAGTLNNNLNLGTGAVTNGGSRIITLNGAGVLSFGGVMTNTAGAANTLTVNNGTGTASTSAVTFGGYALSSNATSYTDTINGSGNVTITGPVTNGGTATASGFTYAGTSTLTLAGNDTYDGSTTITSGTLVLSGSNNNGSGILKFGNGSALQLQANAGNTASGNSYALGVTYGNLTANANGYTFGIQLRSDTSVTFAGLAGIGNLNGATVNFDVNNLAAGSTNGATDGGPQGNTLSLFNNTTYLGTGNTFNITGGDGYTLAIGPLSAVTAGANQIFNATGASATIASFGYTPTSNGTLTLTGASTGNAVLGGISGTSLAVVKSGSGTWTLQSGASTYTGGTTLSAGTLTLGAGSTPTSGTVTSGPIGTGMLTLAGGLLNTSSSASIGDAINVSGSTQLQSSTTGNLVLNGNITGGGNLEVIPTGVLNQVQLGGSNSGYSGTLTVDSGNTAIAFNSASAGSANAAFVLNDNASQRAALAFGTGTINFGSLAGSGYLANTAAGTTTVSVGALNTSGTFSGVLEGNGADAIALTVVGTGALTLAGSNGYSGATTINSGATLQLGTGASGNDGTIGNSSGITDNGTLIYNRYGNLSSNVAISGGGNVTISGSGSQTLTAVNTYNGATTINSGATLQLGNGTGGNDGIIGNTSGVTDNGNLIFNRAGANTASYQIAGTGNVTVSGAGSQTLANGNDNYSGTTTVNGTLIVAGGLTGNGPVTVNSGGTLGAGTGAAGSGGTIDGPVNVAQGGTLAPGAQQSFAGTVMTINNNLTLSGTANMALNLDVNNNADYLVVSGALALDPSTTDTLTLNLLGTMPAPETLTYLIAFYGSESGSFGNIVVNGPAIFDSINYNDANFGGNAISVTLTVVPEPATWASILGGLGMLVAFQRMRRHNSKSQGSL